MSEETEQHDTGDDGLPQKPSVIGKEVSVMYLGTLALILACVFLATVVPLVAQNLYAVVAAVFVGLPYWWLTRRGADFDRFGLTWEQAGRGALWGVGFLLLTLGPFAVGYWWWETQVQERSYEFSADNFYQWPVELDGRPADWEASPGVYVWAEGVELRVGIRTGEAPVEVDVAADRAFRPEVSGQARLSGALARSDVAADSEALGEETSDGWTVFVPANGRAQLVVRRAPSGQVPRDVELDAEVVGTERSVQIYQGASKAEAGSTLEVERGLWWVVLWVLTQVVFIALPEEFFYRGYLQTRIKEALETRRQRRGDDGGEARLLLVSTSNFATSVLFALGHLLIPIGGALVAARASVFFPSLVFGWLRERTGTIAAPVVYHAGANLMVLLAAPHFF